MTHTDTQAALLSAICADPGDMTARLVYADLLMEQGDPRGEFIAVQLDIDGIEKTLAQPYEDVDLCTGVSASWCPVCGDCCCPDREKRMDYHGCPLHHHRSRHSGDDSLRLVLKELHERERKLMGIAWGGWIPKVFSSISNANGFYYCANLYPHEQCPTPNITFRRGFVENVSCTCASWESHGPAIVRQTPVTQVRLTDRKPAHIKIGGSGHRTKYGWVWFSSDAVSKVGFIGGSNHPLSDPQTVPAEWMGGKRRMNFKSCKEADEWLFCTALQWARSTAGLPRWESK